MKMLLIEDNAILAHASQDTANVAGIYSIRLCESTDQALAANTQSSVHFDVALLKRSGAIHADLEQVSALYEQGKIQKFILVGHYSLDEKRALQIAASENELPLLGLLDLPLSSGYLRTLLLDA